jgi:hypothetical protein
MRNVFTEVDGFKFQSKKEAARYIQLRNLERSGEISDLQLQTSYEIIAGKYTDTGRPVKYRADFSYWHEKKRLIEDVKVRTAGVQYRLFQLKKFLMRERYGIEIIEI